MRKAILLVTTLVLASSSAVAWAVAGNPGPGSPMDAGHASAGHAHLAHPGAGPAHAGPVADGLAASVAKARLATAKYVNSLPAARADGYRIITPMMTDMGFHFLNPSVQGFDVEKPPILVYEHTGDAWQLAALEWIFPETPATPPIAGASYGSFPAACHYDDGTFVPADAQAQCAPTSPETGSPFVFWHPPLVTMHVWIWYPNPDGLFASTNPLIAPFDAPEPTLPPGHAS